MGLIASLYLTMEVLSKCGFCDMIHDQATWVVQKTEAEKSRGEFRMDGSMAGNDRGVLASTLRIRRSVENAIQTRGRFVENEIR